MCGIASGGCGGGGSSSSTEDNRTNQNQDNQNTGYDFSIIAGSWTASNGTGSATGANGTFDLRMRHVVASFSNVQVSGNSATATASTSSEWNAYQNGAYATTIYNDYSQATITIQRTGENIWRYTFPDSTSTITVTITSPTTANVTEEGTTSDGYRYTGSYTMTKDDPDSPETYDISALQGTWRPSSGGGSATGNGGSYDLRLNSNGSLTLSNVQVNGNTLSGNMSGTIYWNVYQNGIRIMTAGLEYSRLEMHSVGGNTWRTSDNKATLTLTSQTTASVREQGTFWAYGYPYEYDIVYDIAKR